MLAMFVYVLGFLFTQHYNDSIYFAIILCMLFYLSFIFLHGLFYARPYIFTFDVTVCEFHIALKATWLDLTCSSVVDKLGSEGWNKKFQVLLVLANRHHPHPHTQYRFIFYHASTTRQLSVAKRSCSVSLSSRHVCIYVCRLLICDKRRYYTIEIHKIMKMQMNKKKEKNTV